MVIDCFQLLNELDMLEGRLRYLYNHVDYFVIVESTHTHVRRPKPFQVDSVFRDIFIKYSINQ